MDIKTVADVLLIKIATLWREISFNLAFEMHAANLKKLMLTILYYLIAGTSTEITLSYSFLGITGNILQTAAQNFTVHGNPLIVQDGNDKAVVLNKTGQYIEFLGANTSSCVNNIAQCSSGFKFDIKLKFLDISSTKLFILSSLKEGYSGIEMFYMNETVFVNIVSSKQSWNLVVSYKAEVNIWYAYRIEWSPINGIILFANNILIGQTTSATQVDVNLQPQTLVIGTSSMIQFSYSTHMLITGMKEIIKSENGNDLTIEE